MLSGHCNCGAIRFEITETPTSASYCHCTRCQRRTGAAASPQAGIPEDSLRFLAGEQQIRWWQPPDGYAGRGRSASARSTPATASARTAATAADWEDIPGDGLPRTD